METLKHNASAVVESITPRRIVSIVRALAVGALVLRVAAADNLGDTATEPFSITVKQ